MYVISLVYNIYIYYVTACTRIYGLNRLNGTPNVKLFGLYPNLFIHCDRIYLIEDFYVRTFHMVDSLTLNTKILKYRLRIIAV